jgi:transposase
MDNLAAHKAEAVQEALAAAKIAYRYLPACSPDLNPIEPCWSKLKTRLRARAARTLDALDAELGPALATITAQDAQGWFRRCGYGPPN